MPEVGLIKSVSRPGLPVQEQDCYRGDDPQSRGGAGQTEASRQLTFDPGLTVDAEQQDAYHKMNILKNLKVPRRQE